MKLRLTTPMSSVKSQLQSFAETQTILFFKLNLTLCIRRAKVAKVNVKAADGQKVMFNKDKLRRQCVDVNEAVFTDCFSRKKRPFEQRALGSTRRQNMEIKLGATNAQGCKLNGLSQIEQTDAQCARSRDGPNGPQLP